MISEAVVGALGGGLLRVAPEAMRLLDGHLARRHELKMQNVELEFTKTLGAPRGGDLGVPVPDSTIEAMRESMLDRQAARAGKKFPWIDAASALVRPSVTYTLLGLYVGVRLFGLLSRTYTYGAEDIQIFSGVLAFWFLGRTWERKASV